MRQMNFPTARLVSLALLVLLAASAVRSTRSTWSPGLRWVRKSETWTFPNSLLSGSAGTIEKGLALLHSFQYEESAQTFEEVVQRDGQCRDRVLGKGHGALPSIVGISRCGYSR